MRQTIYTLTFLATLGALSACQQNEIVGRWESVEQKGGLANILEIRSDGTVNSLLIARIDRSYRIEQDKLILTLPPNPDRPHPANEPAAQSPGAAKPTPKDKKAVNQKTNVKQKAAPPEKRGGFYGENGEPVIYVMTHDKDKLKLTHAESKTVMDMQREGQAPTPDPVIGQWSFKHTSGKTAHFIFDTSGIAHFRMELPGGGVKNTYKVKEGTITLYNAEEKPVHSASYKLEKGELVLNDGKSIIRYARIGEAG